jgi:riboflavin biosynthesis pyrimidine reductase
MSPEHRLIDEYQSVVSPVILGAGQQLMSGLSTILLLDLQDAKQHPSGTAMLRYMPR